jgi:hypothetical protein
MSAIDVGEKGGGEDVVGEGDFDAKEWSDSLN